MGNWDDIDKEVERILNLSGEELAEECWIQGEDPDELAQRAKEVIDAAVEEWRRSIN